jgi:CheY-like chemotaxis protein
MFRHVLGGLRVLVASDDAELGRLFATIVEVCGGTVERASTLATARRGLEHRPHVVLLDVAMSDALDLVPLDAEGLKIPVVAFLLRHADPAGAAARLRATGTRLLASTDVLQVCSTLQRAVAEAA